MYLKFKIY